MPLAQEKVFSFAPLCVTESCMRSYQDEADGLNGMNCDEEPGFIGIPSFLRKGRSAPNRSGSGRSMRTRSEKSAFPSAPEAFAGKASAVAAETVSTDIKASLHDMIITAAQLQDASGSFGSGGDAVFRTSCFIIGMLLLDEEWKPYRIQLIKAGEALLKALEGDGQSTADTQTPQTATKSTARTDSPTQAVNPAKTASSSLAAAALAMLTDRGLLKQNIKIRLFESVINALPGNASGLFNEILSGDIEHLPDTDGSTTAADTDKKTRAAQYLQTVINK
jgi:hypothetical protein